MGCLEAHTSHATSERWPPFAKLNLVEQVGELGVHFAFLFDDEYKRFLYKLER